MATTEIHLLEIATSAMVPGLLHHAITERHLDQWQAEWLPLANLARQQLPVEQGVQARPQDLRWDWRRKVAETKKLVSWRSFAVTCGDSLQGLLMVDLDSHQARHPAQNGKPLVYVGFVATAPWNRRDLSLKPRYRGVGSLFMRVAVELSLDMEYKGRIGLHALPQAVSFYEKECGMSFLGNDPRYGNLPYYEMTPEQADAFRA